MSRREEQIIIQQEGSRDNGKVFIAKELSAYEGWEVSQELFRVMGQSGFTSIPDDVIRMGCAGLATLGLSVISAASMESASAIRNRLMKSVTIVIQHDGKEQIRGALPEDFEEIETIRIVLDKVFEINFGFLVLGGE